MGGCSQYEDGKIRARTGWSGKCETVTRKLCGLSIEHKENIYNNISYSYIVLKKVYSHFQEFYA